MGQFLINSVFHVMFLVFTQEEKEQCPYDPNHRVPVRNMEKHKASCSLTKLGYSAEEQVR